MLFMQENDFIGRGYTRVCYRHPHDEKKCIKICTHKQKGKLTINEKESLYYRKISRRKPGFEYDVIPRFHGWVKTNIGEGAVYDLVIDEGTGDVSRTLYEYLPLLKNEPCLERWVVALERFKSSLYKNSILIRDPGPQNICVKKGVDDSLQFVAIDGIGHRDAIPLVDVWPWLARRKLDRQFRRSKMTSINEMLANWTNNAEPEK